LRKYYAIVGKNHELFKYSLIPYNFTDIYRVQPHT